jgi:hypothetical protein
MSTGDTVVTRKWNILSSQQQLQKYLDAILNL